MEVKTLEILITLLDGTRSPVQVAGVDVSPELWVICWPDEYLYLIFDEDEDKSRCWTIWHVPSKLLVASLWLTQLDAVEFTKDTPRKRNTPAVAINPIFNLFIGLADAFSISPFI